MLSYLLNFSATNQNILHYPETSWRKLLGMVPDCTATHPPGGGRTSGIVLYGTMRQPALRKAFGQKAGVPRGLWKKGFYTESKTHLLEIFRRKASGQSARSHFSEVLRPRGE